MTEAKCSVCGHTFTIDLRPQQTQANETGKFAEKAPKVWSVLIACSKCGHRRRVEVSEGG
jgi:DNA-directed RNA polymerase subunit RPC12/RpoP